MKFFSSSHMIFLTTKPFFRVSGRAGGGGESVERRWNWHKISSCTCEQERRSWQPTKPSCKVRPWNYYHFFSLFVQSSSQLKNLYCKYGLMYIFKRSCRLLRSTFAWNIFFMTFDSTAMNKKLNVAGIVDDRERAVGREDGRRARWRRF